MIDRETVATIVFDIVGIIGIIAVIILLAKCSNNKDVLAWNNGYCECGGHWVYEQAVGHRMRTSYIYKCDKCGKILEVWNTNVTEVTENEISN